MVDTAVRSGFGAPSAPAQRNRRARWKDGRLVLGVLLVAVTALAGAKLLSSADDTTTIWAAKHDLPAGTKLTGDDLTTVRVRFTSGDDANKYVAADADLKGLVVARAVDAGEFVPRDAAVSEAENDRTELPLSDRDRTAAVGHRGRRSRWTSGSCRRQQSQAAKLLWSSVRVLQIDSVERRGRWIGPQTGPGRSRSGAICSELPAALAAMGTGEPTLVRRAG